MDSIISAELPNPKFTELFDTINSHHIHGPCCSHGSYQGCINSSGTCSKSFPKQLSERTILKPDSYPIYRRRRKTYDTNKKIKSSPTTHPNQWVAPYNPWFSYRYNCHFYFEVCTSIRAVKYIYK